MKFNKKRLKITSYFVFIFCAVISSHQLMADTRDVHIDAGLSFMKMSQGNYSTDPLSIYSTLGYEINRTITLQAYAIIGLSESSSIYEQVGDIALDVSTRLTQALGVQAKIGNEFSHNKELYFLLGYGNTDVEIGIDVCHVPTDKCSGSNTSASEASINYGVGFDINGFTMSYVVLFDDYVDSLQLDAKVTSLNMGYRFIF